MKPRIFVGSTAEYKKFAEAVKTLLDSDADCDLWHQGVFEIGGNTQTSLVQEFSVCDFAVVILSGDDLTPQSKGKKFLSPRDNLIFEAGISFGAIHPTRTFLIPDNSTNLKIPTDCAGFTFTQPFDGSSDDALVAMRPSVEQIRQRMLELGRKPIQHYSGRLDSLAAAANMLINSADHTVVLFGSDLSWASRYVNTIREKVVAGVDVEVFSDKPSRSKAKDNAKILTDVGATVYYCDADPKIRLTLIDHKSVSVCQFMISFKKRNRSPLADAENRFLYRYTIYDADQEQALWCTLVRLYESLKNEARRSNARK